MGSNAKSGKTRHIPLHSDAMAALNHQIQGPFTALATNESAVRELTDETLKKIAHELTENLRQNLSVDWSERESVRAKLRLMVKRTLRKYKYPPDLLEGAVDLVLQQAQVMGESWG
jgi:type I restriction enzyme R subunit